MPVLPKKATRVRALPERVAHELTFPRVTGYRYELSGERLHVRFGADAGMALSTADVPTKVELEPLIGLKSVHTLDQLKLRREQEVDFLLAKLVYETYFRTEDAAGEPASKPWLFPQLLDAARAWRRQCLTCKDDCFPQMLLLVEYAHTAADKIYRAIVDSTPGERRLLPILQPYDTVGSTSYVDFDTTRPVWPTDPDEVPHLARGLRHRVVGAEDGAGARGDGRGRELRQEPQPRLHDPVHLRGRGAPLHSGLHRADSSA